MSIIIGHHINGQQVQFGGATAPVYEPATGAVRAQVELANADQVGQAVAAAKAAFPSLVNDPCDPSREGHVQFQADYRGTR